MKIRSTKEIGRRSKKKILFRRRSFLYLLFVAPVVYFLRPSGPSLYKTNKRFVILGFDGVEPSLVQRWWEELPNLRMLAEQGTWTKVKTTTPPESPVSWSSFAVGGNPGRHGVFDFLRRPVGSYIPTEEAFAEKQYSEFLFKMVPIKLPKAKLRRGGTAFWDIFGKAGIPTSLVEVPITFPPPNLPHGRALSGLGVPDIRGLQSTFQVFMSAKNESGATETTFGGKIRLLKKESEDYKGTLIGPYDPVADQEKREKEIEKLETDLTWCEWQAQIFSMQGTEHVTGRQKAYLLEYLGKTVIQNQAVKPYLRSSEVSRRISDVTAFIESGRTFVKEEEITASEARMKLADLQKKSRALSKTVRDISRSINRDISFRIIDANSVEIRIGSEIKVAELETWSSWFTIEFPITGLISIKGICRFYPKSISPNLEVYMTSVDMDPRNPPVPISYPKSYAKQLVEWTKGLFKTRGWAAETSGLKDGQLSEDAFIDDLFDLMKKREEKTFETWDRTKSNLFVSVFSATDRVSHMFFHHIDKEHPMHDPEAAMKYGDVIKRVYIRMDEIVGRMMEKIGDDPDTVLMVLSDHGFQSWRYQVNLNTWLIKNGYMFLRGTNQLTSDMKLEDLLRKTSSDFFADVDWSQTKAYALGLGQIYINMKGREALGIIPPSQYETLCDEIAAKLVQLKDDRWETLGQSPVAYVKKRSEIWKGKYADDAHDAPDMQVGFSPGYRVSWQTCLGGYAPEVIEDNMEKWSGDHCSSGSQFVPGVLFCNHKINQSDPAIIDIAPTALSYFDLKMPSEMEGRDLFSQ